MQHMKRIITQSKRAALVIGDVLLLYLSLYAALAIRYGNSFTPDIWNFHLFPFTISFGVWIAIFYIGGLYEPSVAKNNYSFYSLAIKTVLTALAATIILFYLIPSFGIAPKTNLLLMGAIFFALFLLWRHFYNIFIRSSRFSHPTIFIGSNKEMQAVIDIIASHPQLGYHSVAVIETAAHARASELQKLAREHGVDTVVYAKNLNGEHQESSDMAKILYSLLPLHIDIMDLPTFYARITGKIPVSIIGETWFLENLIQSEKDIFEIEKRLLDIIASFVGGVCALIFFPIIALCIMLDSTGPIFYTQRRVGKNGMSFRLVKFRTMVTDAERTGITWTKAEDKRVTKVGSILRKTRIDELPQLWNVFTGDMSFVGPRPERPEFVEGLEKEITHYPMRHLVKPGLTGWAQIHQPFGGASVADSIEKLQYDLYYIKNRSFVIDVDILAKTVLVILRREGR